MLPYYLIIFVMIILSAFFSGSEISFNASNKIRLKKAAESGEKISKVAYDISENFTTALSAILIGNNLANIAASSASTLIVMDMLANVPNSDGLASTIATAVMTVIILIFGEIMPKVLAKQHADTVVKWVAYPVRILTFILYPLVAIIMLLLRLLRKIWGKDNDENSPTVTEDELVTIIETVEQEGVIDEEKSDLLQSTIEFKDTTVFEIMTPRIDLVTIDIDDDFKTICEIADSSRYSRIPVYQNSIDNIIGILFLNHFYRVAAEDIDKFKDSKNAAFDIRPLLMNVCFLHKTMKLPAALKRLRDKKTHIAIVIDEFGGTLGVVTMEDILEEIVGDIWDETDVIVNEMVKIGDNTYEVNGDMNIDDFFAGLDFYPHDFECEYTTVGGWAVEMLDSNPQVGGSFNFEHLYIVVSEMSDMRVVKLTVLVNPLPDDDEE